MYVARAGGDGTRVPVTVDSSKRWRACGVPRGTSLVLVSEREGLTETLARFRVPRTVDLALVGSFNLSVASAVRTASTDSASARLVVRVRAARDSSILRAVEAVVDDSLLVLPNAAGELRISDLTDGTYVITVRSLGFTPAVDTVALVGDRTRVHTVYLERLPPLLAEVMVRGRMVRVPLKFADVLRRAASGWGTVYTSEDFKRAYDFKTLLSQLPGVYTGNNTVGFSRCVSGGLKGTDRPKVQVYIDGVRVTMLSAKGQGESSNLSLYDGPDEVTLALRYVNPSTVEYMEVYRGVAEIPAEFLSDACAVIAIWTKAY